MEEIKRELELATLPEMPKRLDYRIGVIGAGFIVRNCHLEAYRKAGFNPVAITSLDQEQSKEVAALHKIQTVYPTWKELVDDKSIEIIDIAVPPHVQPDIVEYICRHAADHVKGILCQKPIAMSLEEARRIVSLGDEAGIPIAVNSNMRYDQSMRALKRILENRLLLLSICVPFRIGRRFYRNIINWRFMRWPFIIWIFSVISLVILKK